MLTVLSPGLVELFVKETVVKEVGLLAFNASESIYPSSIISVLVS